MEHSMINVYWVTMNQIIAIQNLTKASFLNETLPYTDPELRIYLLLRFI